MNTSNSRKLLLSGLKDGVPTALGYLSVAFGFGISAVSTGLSPFAAVLISLTNLTSAGQLAGLSVIANHLPLIEMALTQLIINIRYFLMSLSLSQKLDNSYSFVHRLVTSFAITDENFGVASSKKGLLKPAYMYGLMTLPIFGWTLGTLLGAVAGNILPATISAALGIAIYGMFIAVIVPPAKEDRGVLVAVIIAVAISCAIAFLPFLSFITSGFAIIIAAIVAAAIAALIFPVSCEEEEK